MKPIVTIFFCFFLSSCIGASTDRESLLEELKIILNKDSIEITDSEHNKLRSNINILLKQNPEDYIVMTLLVKYYFKIAYKSMNWDYTVNYDSEVHELAKEYIDKVIKLNPDYPEIYILLGQYHQDSKRYRQAKNNYLKAKRLGYIGPQLPFQLGLLMLQQKQEKEALEYFMHASESKSDPNSRYRIGSYEYIARINEAEGRLEDANKYYLQTMSLLPNHPWIKGTYSTFLRSKIGDIDGAIKYAKEALDIANYGIGRRIYARALYVKWAILLNEGRPVLAEEHYQEANNNMPNLNTLMTTSFYEPKGELLIKSLVTEKGLSVDSRASDGSTSLLIAVNRNDLKSVKYLIEMGADPNIAAKSGWTPLLSAADKGSKEIVEILLENGADILATIVGLDAASLAERKGKTELSKMLKNLETESY